MKGVQLSEVDVETTLIQNVNILDGLENKRLSAKDWVSELASQVYTLNKICLAQQEEIKTLQEELGRHFKEERNRFGS